MIYTRGPYVGPGCSEMAKVATCRQDSFLGSTPFKTERACSRTLSATIVSGELSMRSPREYPKDLATKARDRI